MSLFTKRKLTKDILPAIIILKVEEGLLKKRKKRKRRKEWEAELRQSWLFHVRKVRNTEVNYAILSTMWVIRIILRGKNGTRDKVYQNFPSLNCFRRRTKNTDKDRSKINKDVKNIKIKNKVFLANWMESRQRYKALTRSESKLPLIFIHSQTLAAIYCRIVRNTCSRNVLSWTVMEERDQHFQVIY